MSKQDPKINPIAAQHPETVSSPGLPDEPPSEQGVYPLLKRAEPVGEQQLPRIIGAVYQQFLRKRRPDNKFKALIRCLELLHNHIVCFQFADYMHNSSVDHDLNDLLDEFLLEEETSIVFFYLMLEHYRLNSTCSFLSHLKNGHQLPISYEDWENISLILEMDDPLQSNERLLPKIEGQLRFFNFLDEYALVYIESYRPNEQQFVGRLVEQADDVVIINRQTSELVVDRLYAKHGETWLSLYPFVLYRTCSECGQKHLFYYQFFNQHEAVYRNFEYMHTLEVRHQQFITEVANLLAQKRCFSQAILWYEAILKIDPNHKIALSNLFAAHNLLGIQYFESKRYREASEQFRYALALRPDISQIYFNLALAYRKGKKPEHALATISHLLEREPNMPKALETKAQLLEDLNRKDEALKAYEAALKLDATSNRLFANWQRVYEQTKKGQAAEKEKETKPTALELLTEDLTARAKEGQFEPIEGRQHEIHELLEILICRHKNNALIIGEPGVGKSAIVAETARLLHEKAVPIRLYGKRLLQLNTGALVAGTKFRGELEDRVMQLLNELKQDPNIILFVDEFHAIVHSGATKGGLADISGMLKPALANGEVQCIGTATLEEYRRSIEKDPTLDRRFQIVRVEEPDPAETISILKSVKHRVEAHHAVTIDELAVDLAAELPKSFLRDRALPDKAIDLLDRASAIVAYDRQPDDQQERHVTGDDIVSMVSKLSGVPVNKIDKSNAAHYRNMESVLKKKLIGQDEAVQQVAKVIRANRLKLKLQPQRPEGVFLFLGPTGVGKTELARVLSEFLFGSVDDMIRIDMSEFSDRIATSKLIGAAPGYVGYNDPNQLTDRVRNHPYTLILLDEIEKADPMVLNIFLQVFDAGRLTDSKGRDVLFDHTTIIMTSNIGSNLYSQSSIGYSGKTTAAPQKSSVSNARMQKELHKWLRPEFMGRIDEIILFNPLTAEDVKQIAHLHLQNVYDQLALEDKKLILAESALDLIVAEGYSSEFGARHIDKVIRTLLLEPLALKKLQPTWDHVREIKAYRYADELRFRLVAD